MPLKEEFAADRDAVIDTAVLDLSSIVGHPVRVYSEQFPGQHLESRVLEARGQSFSLDRSGSGRRIDNLVHNQMITLQFEYRGEQVSVRALLKRTAGGRCNILLDRQAQALTRRKFMRADLTLPTRLTVLPMSTLHSRKLSQLRWIEVDSANFSSGGVLLELSSFLEADCLLLMNISQDIFDFPALVAGRVRYCHQINNGRFHVGIEFIVNEDRTRLFSEAAARALPPVVFEYNRKLRLWLNGQIVSHMSTIDRQ